MIPYTKIKRKTNLSRVIVIGFALVILTGALLLTLPISNADGQREGFLTCLFTATSATCVTGLVVVDTALHWSTFGEGVILALIQVGGLGFMTLAVSLSMLVRRAISPKERLLLAQSVSALSASGLVKLTKRILRGTIIFESLGALILMTRFLPLFGPRGIWKAVFISVSAFCNAGFDLMGDYSGEFTNLVAFNTDPVVCITVMLLIIIGGIGFIVWDDILRFFTEKKRIPTYTKIIISFTLFLIVGGALLFLAAEWYNPETIGSMNIGDKVLNSFFQSVTPRTAGFNTVNLNGMQSETKLLLMALMFIGGCSGSTAGGIKVGTFAIIVLTIHSVLRGKTNILAFNRKISEANILRAFSVAAVQLIVTVAGGLVIVLGGEGVMSSMFEAFSASGTVGLSLSLTPTLGPLQLIAMIILMFFGRVGILTVSCAIVMKISQTTSEYSNAEARLIVG